MAETYRQAFWPNEEDSILPPGQATEWAATFELSTPTGLADGSFRGLEATALWQARMPTATS